MLSVRRLWKHLAARRGAAAQQTKANTEQLGKFLSNNKLISQTPGGKVFFLLTVVIGDSSLLHTSAEDGVIIPGSRFLDPNQAQLDGNGEWRT